MSEEDQGERGAAPVIPRHITCTIHTQYNSLVHIHHNKIELMIYLRENLIAATPFLHTFLDWYRKQISGLRLPFLMPLMLSVWSRLLRIFNPVSHPSRYRLPSRYGRRKRIWRPGFRKGSPKKRGVKLLLYSHYFAPSIGGVETIVISLARGLVELRAPDGAQEFAITLATKTSRGEFDDQGLPFAVVRRPGIWQLLRLVCEADVIHIAGPSFVPMLLAWLMQKPYVVEHHTYQSICPNGLLIHQPERSVCPGHFQTGNYAECWRCKSREVSKIRSLFNVIAALPRHALTRSASRNIAVSEHVRRKLSVPRTSVVQHGVAGESETASPIPIELRGGEKICFGFVGRFVPEKGLSVLVDALVLLAQKGREFEAKLIGDGPERSKIEAQIAAAKLDSRAKITGFLSGAALDDAVADVAVVVMPSVWEETAGLAAIEQMMRGRLVIYSDIGGLSEIVGDAGMKFPAGNAGALASSLCSVIDNPLLIEELGSRALARVSESFLRSRMIENHASIYREFATGRRADTGWLGL